MPVDRKRALEISFALLRKIAASDYDSNHQADDVIMEACDEHAAPALEALREIMKHGYSTSGYYHGVDDPIESLEAIFSAARKALEKYENKT